MRLNSQLLATLVKEYQDEKMSEKVFMGILAKIIEEKQQELLQPDLIKQIMESAIKQAHINVF